MSGMLTRMFVIGRGETHTRIHTYVRAGTVGNSDIGSLRWSDRGKHCGHFRLYDTYTSFGLG